MQCMLEQIELQWFGLPILAMAIHGVMARERLCQIRLTLSYWIRTGMAESIMKEMIPMVRTGLESDTLTGSVYPHIGTF